MSAEIVAQRTLTAPVKVLLKRAGQDEREELITELEVHKFKAKDLRAIDGIAENDRGSMGLALAARITRQPIRVIDELEGEDFHWLMQQVEDFLPGGRATGATAPAT